MLREDWVEKVQAQMPAKRWTHTQGVMKAAAELADRFGADRDKAEVAALFHDYCKYWPVDKQLAVLQEHGVVGDLASYDAALWHGPAAAEVVRSEFDMEDQEVLDAIRWHTSGREEMTLLDKIVCLADYIEEGRDFPGVDRIREKARTHLEEALIEGFNSTISYLLERGGRIYPLTVLSRNALIEACKSRS